MDAMRFRDLGLVTGRLSPGSLNAITDVEGVLVGHVTLDAGRGFGRDVCTGVTAILPHAGNVFRNPRVTACHVFNGYGKTTGLVQLSELGLLESPILLTNTFSVPAVTEGALRHLMQGNPEIGDDGPSVNVVVAECNDSYLNDMRGLHVRPEDAIEAIRTATRGSVEQGAVGAGRGMRCFGWKGGIGTSSRRVPDTPYTIGALVLSNFGAPDDLTIMGVPVGQHLQREEDRPADGSIIVVLATDLPWDSLLLSRLARRTPLALARLGSIGSPQSGDIAIAFSTADPDDREGERGVWPGATLSGAFRAAVEATEEAILNSLVAAKTTEGRRGRVVPGLPMERVVEILRRRL